MPDCAEAVDVAAALSLAAAGSRFDEAAAVDVTAAVADRPAAGSATGCPKMLSVVLPGLPEALVVGRILAENPAGKRCTPDGVMTVIVVSFGSSGATRR